MEKTTRALPMIINAFFLGILASCSQVVGSPPAPLPVYQLPVLSVSGNQLKDSSSSIELRGVTVEEYSALKDRNCLSLFANLKESWKANAVRIMVNPGTWQTEEVQPEAFAAKLKDLVSTALDRGLYVILDYHALGWPDGYEVPLNWPNPTNRQLANRFWTLMAKTFHDGRILFELWNEPQKDPAAPAPTASDWAQLKGYHQEWIASIRSQGNNNVVLASGLNSASRLVEVAASPLTGANIGYSWHIYPSENLAEGTGGNYTTWNSDLANLPSAAPVVLTEWGFDPTVARGAGWDELVGTADRFGAFFRDQIIDQLHLSAISWGFANYTYGSVFADKDYSRLTAYGGFVQGFLARSYVPLYNNSGTLTTTLSTQGRLYLFHFPSGTIGGGYSKMYDGTITNQASVVDGYYLINYSVAQDSKTAWANSLGMGFQVGGVTLNSRRNNPQGNEMLAFRVVGGRIFNGW